MEYPCDPLWDALRQVQDPEWPISLVDMGMIYRIDQTGGQVTVDLTFTAMGCPATHFILEDTRAALLAVAGVEQVEIRVVWSPPWNAARLSAEGRETMMCLGVSA